MLWEGGASILHHIFKDVTYNASKVSPYLSDQDNEPKHGGEYNPNSSYCSRGCLPPSGGVFRTIIHHAWDISGGVRELKEIHMLRLDTRYHGGVLSNGQEKGINDEQSWR